MDPWGKVETKKLDKERNGRTGSYDPWGKVETKKPDKECNGRIEPGGSKRKQLKQ